MHLRYKFELFYDSIAVENGQSKIGERRLFLGKHPSYPNKKLHRRLLLEFMGFIPSILYALPTVAAPMFEMKEPEVTR